MGRASLNRVSDPQPHAPRATTAVCVSAPGGGLTCISVYKAKSFLTTFASFVAKSSELSSWEGIPYGIGARSLCLLSRQNQTLLQGIDLRPADPPTR